MDSIRATIAIWLAIPLVFWLLNKYGSAKGALIAALGGMMFLPEHAWIKIPMLPEFDKHRVVLVGLLIAMVVGKLRVRGKPEWWWYILFALCSVSGILTWLTNLEPMFAGPKVIPALKFNDAMYLSLQEALGPPLMVYVGMRVFRDEKDLDTWLRVMAGLGLIYCVPILLELRFSPQMHVWVYGYAGHDMFLQTIRFGGYRPQVLTAHGLACSLLMLGTAMAAAALARQGEKLWKWSAKNAAWFLIVITILCKSTGVWIYGLVGLPLLRWASAKTMVRTALVLAAIVVSYPYLRITDQFPTQAVLDAAQMIQDERMYSMKFRFDNEDVLLTHAVKKPWYGWSYLYGRNRLYDDGGGDITVTDGGWIISFGSSGIIGLFTSMGAPVIAMLAVYFRLSKIRDTKAKNALGALTLYLSFMLMDVVPNAAFNWLQWLMAGALCGMSQGIIAKQKKKPAKKPAAAAPAPASAPSQVDEAPDEQIITV